MEIRTFEAGAYVTQEAVVDTEGVHARGEVGAAAGHVDFVILNKVTSRW